MNDMTSGGLVRTSSDEAPDAEGVYRIWPGERAPGTEDWTWSERTKRVPWTETDRRVTRNVVTPTVTVFRPPADRANGTAMIVAPGGAFHFLMVDHEGYDLARRLAGMGITAFVLKYRLGRSPDDDSELATFRNDLQQRLHKPDKSTTAPPARFDEIRQWGEEDGRQAVRFVREHAAQWNLDPTRIGIAGFSAGGGVAMAAAFEEAGASRPDFAVGIYPAWRGERVPEDPPPLFLVIADDDQSVAPMSSSRLYEMWHTAGGAAELHVFGSGAHGFGMGTQGTLSDAWAGLLDNWLKARGLA